MSKRVVVDSSALLALVLGEKGEDVVERIIRQAVISTVNVGEVYSRLGALGPDAIVAGEIVLALLAGVEPFTLEHAKAAGLMRIETRGRGLSLGDRACLALACSLGVEVYTADQGWRGVSVGCEIKFIRSHEDETSVQ